ncbi:hypothetical protein FRC20_008512 [Serendipita sp. 405]|nr:hypothetical protein FRC20_008512 [Serendipita sp. 405]
MSIPATPWPAHIRGCPSLLDGYKVEDTEVILGVPRNNPMALINFSFVLLALLPLAFQARACDDVHAWGQCGGIGYTGSTTCASGLICQEWNPWYVSTGALVWWRRILFTTSNSHSLVPMHSGAHDQHE